MASTRDRLLEAGLRLFADRGVAGTSVSDVEREAGLRPGSGGFYRHFPSKEDLFRAVVAQERDRAMAVSDGRQRVAVSSLGSARADLLLAFRAALVGLAAFRPAMQIVQRERSHFPELIDGIVGALVDDTMASATKRFVEAAHSGELQIADPEATAVVVVGALVSFELLGELGAARNGVDQDRFIAALAELALSTATAR